jgi:hypothetical protein
VNFPPAYFSFRIFFLASLAALAMPAASQDVFLPLPEAGPELPLLTQPEGVRFLKPSKSIKPPASAAIRATVAAVPQVSTPTVARLRRVILLPSGLPQDAMRQQMAEGSQSRQPVTAVGVHASAQVLAKLAELFGSEVNDSTPQKVEEAVRLGLNSKEPTRTSRRVQVVGWQAKDGVMAVAVDPES